MCILKNPSPLFFILLLQGCGLFTSEEEKRVNNVESILVANCDPDDNFDLRFNGIGDGRYLLEIETHTKDLEVAINPNHFDKRIEQEKVFSNQQLRLIKDPIFHRCFKNQLPIILDILRTPQQRLTKCIQDNSDDFIAFNEFKTDEQFAITPSSGFAGGHITKEVNVCYSGRLYHDAIEASFKRMSCIEGRCDIGDIITKTDQSTGTASACVLIKSWSESKSFGAGGKVSGYLYGSVKRTLTEAKKENIIEICEAQNPILLK